MNDEHGTRNTERKVSVRIADDRASGNAFGRIDEMNAAHIHLALNNFPPFVNLIAVLLLVGGMFARSSAVIRAALWIIVLTALVTVPVYLTGERAEDIVEYIEGVNAVAIHPHEESGEWTLTVVSIEGAAALAVLLFFRRELPRWAAPVMMLLALIACATLFRTAYLGGRIHHPETEMNR